MFSDHLATAAYPGGMFRSIIRRPIFALAIAAAGAAALPGSAFAAPVYAQVTGDDAGRCANGRGPAVKVAIDGLKSAQGNLFVRVYRATDRDWLKSKRYLWRVDTRPRAGSMTVCVPIPSAGRYAIAVQHDVNGNSEVDFSTDGVGMSNNPPVPRFLGIPRPPAVAKTAFTAGSGVTPISVTVRYRD